MNEMTFLSKHDVLVKNLGEKNPLNIFDINIC